MPWRKYTDEDGDSKTYALRMQREKYANDVEVKAKSHLKYYKKKYKDDTEWQVIFNQQDISKKDILVQTLEYNLKKKINKKLNKQKKSSITPPTQT